jgi:hypothetical protein
LLTLCEASFLCWWIHWTNCGLGSASRTCLSLTPCERVEILGRIYLVMAGIAPSNWGDAVTFVIRGVTAVAIMLYAWWQRKNIGRPWTLWPDESLERHSEEVAPPLARRPRGNLSAVGESERNSCGKRSAGPARLAATKWPGTPGSIILIRSGFMTRSVSRSSTAACTTVNPQTLVAPRLGLAAFLVAVPNPCARELRGFRCGLRWSRSPRNK